MCLGCVVINVAVGYMLCCLADEIEEGGVVGDAFIVGVAKGARLG